MTPKTRVDIRGLEHDWLGTDGVGCVALFSTAGYGHAPMGFLRDTDAHDMAIDAIIALPPTTEAKFAPELPPGCINTWRLVAERGLFAYDCEPDGGRYRLVAAPIVAVPVDALPPAVAKVASAIRCPLRFEGLSIVTADELPE